MNTAPQVAPRRQRGVALIVLLTLVAFVLIGALMTSARSSGDSSFNARDIKTMAAMAQAKEALIAYATTRDLRVDGAGDCDPALKINAICPRPGGLPCPDFDNDGWADTHYDTGTNYAYPQCSSRARIGRLPWKTLGLPDLRDSSGERLWYAVSASYVENSYGTCSVPGDAGCLNSNTNGALTVRAGNAFLENDGTGASAAVAVLIAPGLALTRLDGVVQDRSCDRGGSPDATCQSSGACTNAGDTPWLTASCNPINYMDVAQPPLLPVAGATSSKEDNATYGAGTATDGFVRGPMMDSAQRVRLNDVVLALTPGDIMPAVEKRVAREALSCLRAYALANNGRYPWAANNDQTGPSGYFTDFQDSSGVRFGHLADGRVGNPQFTHTFGSSVTVPPLMSTGWTTGCSLSGAWWWNWKNLVYYGVASGYAPDANPTGCTGTNCLTVSTVSPANDKKVVIIVAGRSLGGGQPRAVEADWDNMANYLEGGNASGATFQTGHTSASFNDVVVYEQE